MKAGFTKAYRKELNSNIWKMSPLYHRVFYYLRQKAEWTPNIFPTSRKFGIALNPGQLITSMSIIAKDVSWKEYGVRKEPNKKTIKKSNRMAFINLDRFNYLVFQHFNDPSLLHGIYNHSTSDFYSSNIF